jgi:hypothetical protein
MESAFLHFDFGRSFSTSDREITELLRQGVPVDAAVPAGGIAAGLAVGADRADRGPLRSRGGFDPRRDADPEGAHARPGLGDQRRRDP